MATYKALQRRGLAYDLVGILSFKDLVAEGFRHLTDPGSSRPQPPDTAAGPAWLELGSRQPTLTRAAAYAPLADDRCLDRVFLEATNTVAVNFHFMLTRRVDGSTDKGGKGAGRGPKRRDIGSGAPL